MFASLHFRGAHTWQTRAEIQASKHGKHKVLFEQPGYFRVWYHRERIASAEIVKSQRLMLALFIVTGKYSSA
jgi:hypothetical protein